MILTVQIPCLFISESWENDNENIDYKDDAEESRTKKNSITTTRSFNSAGKGSRDETSRIMVLGEWKEIK